MKQYIEKWLKISLNEIINLLRNLPQRDKLLLRFMRFTERNNKITNNNTYKYYTHNIYLGKPKIQGKNQPNEISLALAKTLANLAK